MTRRDRHGRVIQATIYTYEDWQAFDVSNQLDAVDRIARRIYVDRNAAGAPAKYRSEIRTSMRPWLAKAAAFAGKARAALLRGDESAFELNKAHANLCLERAQAVFRQPFMDSYRAQTEVGKRGGRPRKDDQAAAWARRYERMEKTHRLNARERYEQIASEDLGTDAKWRTVRNAISEYRKRQK